MEKRGVFMIKDLYYNNIIIYAFAALCGLGVILRFILDIVYIYLVKESDKLGTTKNKLLKHMRMKYETCYKLNIAVNNVDTFVDKNLTKYRFCGLLLSTWENISGQVLLLSFLIVPISAVFGVFLEVDRKVILYTGAVGILGGAALIFVDKMINLPVKKRMIRLNLLDYLENFCKVRLEQEAKDPKKLELYREEYLSTVSLKDQKINYDPDSVKEINRRKEARKRKEEEKRLRALEREKEQKKIEEARRQEEQRRLEERKRLAQQRREEEFRRLQDEKTEKNQIRESIEEVAAEYEEAKKPIFINMSPEEEKVVEDVLREFFA